MTSLLLFILTLQLVFMMACSLPYYVQNGTVSWCYNEYYTGPDLASKQYRVISGAIDAAAAGVFRNQSYSYSQFSGLFDEKIHALVQCREDISFGSCLHYLKLFNESIMVLPYCKIGGMRNDLCVLRFDTRDYFDYDNTEFIASAYTGGQGPPKLTKEIVNILLTKMIRSMTNGSRTVVGTLDYAGHANVYGLATCIDQMLPKDCIRCLTSALDQLLIEYNSSAGVSMLRPSCLLRYSVDKFYNSSGLLAINVSLEMQGNSSSHRHGAGLKIGLGSAGAAILVVCVLGICALVLRRPKQRQISEGGNFSYKALVDATANFSALNELGSGGCGIVYKGLLTNKVPVAVKKMMKGNSENMLAEVSLVTELNHENILKLLGYCFHGTDTFLVYDYMANQTLDRYFKDKLNRKQLSWSTWYNIIKGIACGLRYLHLESGKNILHRDLKPNNILLDSAFSAKIADFDLAKIYNRAHTHENTDRRGGTFGYMAPELYHYGEFSTKSDIYSYGVVMLEILTGYAISKFNINGSTDLIAHVWSLFKLNKAADVLDCGYLGITNSEELKEALQCIKVALLCLESEPSRRPETEKLSTLLSHPEVSDPSNPGFSKNYHSCASSDSEAETPAALSTQESTFHGR